MTGLLAAAMASREAERVALLAEVARWKRASLCDVCRRELPAAQAMGAARKRHAACQGEHLKRERAGWRKPKGHRAIVQRTPDPAIVAARAEFHAAVAASREARRKLKALVAAGRARP